MHNRLRLIFIRYLIDRGVKLDEKYVGGKTLVDRRRNFSELIRQPKKLNDFFEWLNDKFNGVLFKNINIIISSQIANQLASVFQGELPEKGSLFDGTDYYFEIFDFSIIPVELISGIYEALIDEDTRKLHSAVYTPSFLVEYILTNTVDVFFDKRENRNVSECKIFDPAVGSGIFLVQGFRRMVDRDIALNGPINRTRLREIVYNNLFGIDINEQALKVTCFSIYIAMLDYFEPSSILPKFEFPNLIGHNLFVANFFDTDSEFNTVVDGKHMDFILGNPPWKSDKDSIHLNWLEQQKKVVGGYEIAQSFLLRSKDFMHSSTKSALIVTSTIFYNISKKTKKFRQEFLTQFCVKQFFDLSPVRRLIFEEKNNPCAIVFYEKEKNKNYLTNVVRHFSLKSNLFLKYFKVLIIEKNDQKEIFQKHFIENGWMFKVALYGNTLDFGLLKKLERNNKKIIDLVDDIVYFKGAGIERGKKGRPYVELLNLPIIENKGIKPYFSVVPDKRLTENDILLSRGRRIEIFQGSKILFKEQNEDESNPLISFIDGICVFRKGISSLTTNNVKDLMYIYGIVISNLYTYYLFIKSCSWGVSTRPQTRLDEEYLAFPYIETDRNKKNKLLELVYSFIAQYQTFYSSFNLGEPKKNEKIFKDINAIVESLYEIKEHEKDLINYVLDISRYQFQASKLSQVIRKVDNDHELLSAYAEVYIQEFEGLYEGEFMQVKVYPLKHFIAMSFEFGADKPSEKLTICTEETDESQVLNIIASNISFSKITDELYVQKDIKGFEDDSFYIIKPNEYKCWHRALAWYDVAEFKKKIEDSEVDYLNANMNE